MLHRLTFVSKYRDFPNNFHVKYFQAMNSTRKLAQAASKTAQSLPQSKGMTICISRITQAAAKPTPSTAARRLQTGSHTAGPKRKQAFQAISQVDAA
jgi:hypothetical protein